MDNRFASGENKQKIIDLLKNPVFTEHERTAITKQINSYSEKASITAIELLNKVIKSREAKNGN